MIQLTFEPIDKSKTEIKVRRRENQYSHLIGIMNPDANVITFEYPFYRNADTKVVELIVKLTNPKQLRIEMCDGSTRPLNMDKILVECQESPINTKLNLSNYESNQN